MRRGLPDPVAPVVPQRGQQPPRESQGNGPSQALATPHGVSSGNDVTVIVAIVAVVVTPRDGVPWAWEKPAGRHSPPGLRYL